MSPAALLGARRRVGMAVAAAIFVSALLYLKTLAPSVVGGDSGELMAAAHVLGVPHPPGYPTFTLLAHGFSRLPFGDPAIGMNLLSAVADSLAVGVVVLCILVLVGSVIRPPLANLERTVVLAAALLGGALLATSTAFWTYSLVSEVFALNNLLAALITAAMLLWASRVEDPRPLWLAAILSGLAVTNQQTIVLLAPGLLILYGHGLRSAARSGSVRLDMPSLVRLGLIPAALFAVGLLPYVYLPLAAAGDPVVNWGDPRTLDRFWAVVTRESYGTLSLTVRETRGGVIDQLVLLAAYLWTAFTPAGLALAGIGLWILGRARPVVAVALAVMFGVSGPLFVAFANPPLDDPVTRGVLERFYILPSLPLALLAGTGAAAAARWAVGRAVRPARQSAAPAVAAATVAVAVALVGVIVAVRYPHVDQSRNRVAETYAHDVLEPLAPDAILLTRSDENYTSVVFAQVVRGMRPDVTALDVELLKLPSYVAQARRQHPSLDIPFGAYDDGARTSLASLVSANLGRRPVFAIGRFNEDLGARFDEIPWGLTRQIVRSGEAPSGSDADRAAADRFEALHPPTRSWPATTWEGAMAANYGSAAFELALARHKPGALPDATEIADLYRTAIRLAPQLASAYKNLGLLLLDNGGPRDEIIAAWRTYLELEPADPQADAIRTELRRLEGGG